MRILKWSGRQLAGYRFACPEWIREGFGTGTLSGYVCVDEEEACVASYLAFYLSDDAAEVVAHGVAEGYDPAVTLGRLYGRLKQHCREREIVRIEEEIIGRTPETVENTLLREDFLPMEESGGLWRSTPAGAGERTAPCDRDALRPVEGLDEKERESLLSLMMTADEEAVHEGSLISELCLLYWQDGRAAACVFCGDYRGSVRADRIYVLPGREDCLKSLWAYIREETGRIRPACDALYFPSSSGAACLMEEAEPVGVNVWSWLDAGMDGVSFREAELLADMALGEQREMGALMLTRLTPFAHMLEEEGETYDFALDEHMFPQVMITANGLGEDYIVEVGCQVEDVEQGSFTFTMRTEFAGYADAGEAAVFLSRVNKRLERAIAYWDGKGSIVLQGYAVDDECSDVIRWRKFLRNWTADCHVMRTMSRDSEKQNRGGLYEK